MWRRERRRTQTNRSVDHARDDFAHRATNQHRNECAFLAAQDAVGFTVPCSLVCACRLTSVNGEKTG